MSMSPATTARSSIAPAAAIGIARLISPTRTGIPALPSKVWANSQPASLLTLAPLPGPEESQSAKGEISEALAGH